MVHYNTVNDIQFNDAVINEPVTLVEAKNFCKIDIGTDDDLLTSLIIAARQICEAYTGVGFVSHSAVANLSIKNDAMYLPYGPTGSINQVTNKDGDVMVLDIDYEVGGNTFKWIRLLSNYMTSEITVDYSTGYEELPNVLKTAILNQVYFMYDNRAQGIDSIGPIAKMILNPYKRV
jgi:uncharacterized phiE125 gp8 family phage protein